MAKAPPFTEQQLLELALLLEPDEALMRSLTSPMYDIPLEEVCDQAFIYMLKGGREYPTYSAAYRQMARMYGFAVLAKLPEIPWGLAKLVLTSFETVTHKKFLHRSNILDGVMVDSFARTFHLRFERVRLELEAEIRQRYRRAANSRHETMTPTVLDSLLRTMLDFAKGVFLSRPVPGANVIELPESGDLAGAGDGFDELSLPSEDILQYTPAADARPPRGHTHAHVPDVVVLESSSSPEQAAAPPATPREAPTPYPEPVLPVPKHVHHADFMPAERQITVQPHDTYRLYLLCLALWDFELLTEPERGQLRLALLGASAYFLDAKPLCSAKSEPFLRELIKGSRNWKQSPFRNAAMEHGARAEQDVLNQLQLVFHCLPTALDQSPRVLDLGESELDIRRSPWLVSPTPIYYAHTFNFAAEVARTRLVGLPLGRAVARVAAELALQPNTIHNHRPYSGFASWVEGLLRSPHTELAREVLGAPADVDGVFPPALAGSTANWLGLQTHILLTRFAQVQERQRAAGSGHGRAAKPLWLPESFAPVLLTALTESLEERTLAITQTCRDTDFYRDPKVADYRLQQVLLFASLTTKPLASLADQYEAVHTRQRGPTAWHIQHFVRALESGPSPDDWNEFTILLDAYVGLMTRYGAETPPARASRRQAAVLLDELADFIPPSYRGRRAERHEVIGNVMSWLLHLLPFLQITSVVVGDIEKVQPYYDKEYPALWDTWRTVVQPLFASVNKLIPRSFIGVHQPLGFHTLDQIATKFLADNHLTVEQRISIGTFVCFMNFSDEERLSFVAEEHFYRDVVLLQMAATLAQAFEESHPRLYEREVSPLLAQAHNPTHLARELASLCIVQPTLQAAVGHPAYQRSEPVERVLGAIGARKEVLLRAWEAGRLAPAHPEPHPTKEIPELRSSHYRNPLAHKRAGSSVLRMESQEDKPTKRQRRRVGVPSSGWVWDREEGRYIVGTDLDDGSQPFDPPPGAERLARSRSHIRFSTFDRALLDMSWSAGASRRFQLHATHIFRVLSNLQRAGDFADGPVFQPRSQLLVRAPFVVFVLDDTHFKKLLAQLGLNSLSSTNHPAVRLLATGFVARRPTGADDLLRTFDGEHLISWPALLAQHVLPQPPPAATALHSDSLLPCLLLGKPLALGYVS